VTVEHPRWDAAVWNRNETAMKSKTRIRRRFTTRPPFLAVSRIPGRVAAAHFHCYENK
jgi:hypothetical protein